jgi:hypothetical protein
MKWSLKLKRIYQPSNPLFWLMLIINALSYALGWIVQNRALNVVGMLLVGGFAIVNAVVGTWLMWRLLQTDPEGKPLPKPPQR